MKQTSLRCPGCAESMIEVDSEGVLIDVCSGCNALWLDKGELEQLGGRLPSHSGVQVQIEKKRQCPRCQFPMDPRDAHVVRVDICWGCGGLFLDSTAYEALVEAAGGRKPAPDDDATPAAGLPAFVPGPSTSSATAARATSAATDTGAAVAAAVATVAAVGTSKAANREPASANPAATLEARASEPQKLFWCDLCRQPFPVSEQVMGERITACPACAARQGIKHDPKARRKAERQNVELNKFEDDLDPATLISSALRYLLGQ